LILYGIEGDGDTEKKEKPKIPTVVDTEDDYLKQLKEQEERDHELGTVIQLQGTFSIERTFYHITVHAYIHLDRSLEYLKASWLSNIPKIYQDVYKYGHLYDRIERTVTNDASIEAHEGRS
jgi:hypothetical protein